MTSNVVRLLLMGGAWPLVGCSLLFTTKPPRNIETLPPSAPVECTTSKAAPVIDTVVAGLQVIRTAVAASADDSDYEDAPISREADIGFGLAFAALFTASAAYGYTVTGQCRQAKNRMLEEPQGQPFQPAPARPPAPAPPPPLCSPGTTQECVGPGGCKGGQACDNDGKAWGACDCGDAEAQPPAESPELSGEPPEPVEPALPLK